MFGTLSGELEVSAPASAVWEVYRSKQLAAVTEKGFADVLEKLELVEGDGFLGSVFHIVFRPGVAFPSFKEKVIKIDDEKRIKEALVVGGYLEMGFERYVIRFEIIEKDEKSCITKATIEYQLKEESAANASLVKIDTLMATMNIANSHVVANSPVLAKTN
ncbi:S-norcoclaurine synthase [Heracleum sosnowskyi]|uniref:S-norcoclaurine synthase n=1 Tax=Heracleum sosnowskyi TaxID=360622 RepID=A0AAD8M8R5_9APIA|nr:S-norcoclaurine synthase [Heracleum sosnowskyi]